jgi:uncharacterized membrane protein YheB (UPF0754 family)
MNLSKATITDIVSVIFIGIGISLPDPYYLPILSIGLFAFSGAITNQVAIYMLFNRVPLLYGSGVIENNFDTFKSSIKDMIMQEFFNPKQLREFFENEKHKIDLVPLVKSADFSPAFNALSQSVMESKFGEMLNMFGGEKALESMREPFANKLKLAVVGIVSSDSFNAQINHHLEHSTLNDDLRDSVESLINNRLNDLTPKMVNDLVHKLIHSHLGWLVVWGGIFGGLIGLASSFIL